MYLSVQEWMTDFRTFGGLAPIADELKSRGLDRASIGLVGFSSTIQTTPTLLHEDVVNLEKMLPQATFIDASAILQDMRMVKSEEEIDMLRGAGKIARKVVDAMIDTARPGRHRGRGLRRDDPDADRQRRRAEHLQSVLVRSGRASDATSCGICCTAASSR